MNTGKVIFNATMFLTGVATGYMLDSKFNISNKIEKLIGITSPTKKTIELMEEGHTDAINNADIRGISSTSRSNPYKKGLSEILNSEKYVSEEGSKIPDEVVIHLDDPNCKDLSNYVVIEGDVPKNNKSENFLDENSENSNPDE